MALPACQRCGKQDPQRMHGLMTLWFGPLVELEGDLGYFYLCPACHDEIIVPELERIQNRILELHPAAQRHFDELDIEVETDGPDNHEGEGEAGSPDREVPADPGADSAGEASAPAEEADGAGEASGARDGTEGQEEEKD